MATSLRPSNNEKPCCQGTLCGRQQPSDHVAAERPVAVPASAALGLALACALTDTVLRPRTSVVCAVCVHRALTTDVRRGGHDTVKRLQVETRKRITIEITIRRTDHISLSINTNLLCAVCIIPNFACTVVEVDVVATLLYTRNTVARVQL